MSNCVLCDAINRVFNGRYAKCSDVVSELSEIGVIAIKNRLVELTTEAITKLHDGTISESDAGLVGTALAKYLPLSAANVPATTLMHWPETDPETMMRMVETSMVNLIREAFKTLGPDAEAELMNMLNNTAVPQDPTKVN